MSRKRQTKKPKTSKPKSPRPSSPKKPPILATRPFPEKRVLFTEAYKRTGDLSLAVAASGLSRGQAKDLIAATPELHEDVRAVLARCGVTPELIITQQRRLATSDPRKLYDSEGNLRPMHLLDDDTAAAVTEATSFASEYERRDGGSVRETKTHLKLAGKDPALRELSRMMSLVEERSTVQVANRPGESFSVETPRESRADVIASLLSLVTPKPDPK